MIQKNWSWVFLTVTLFWLSSTYKSFHIERNRSHPHTCIICLKCSAHGCMLNFPPYVQNCQKKSQTHVKTMFHIMWSWLYNSHSPSGLLPLHREPHWPLPRSHWFDWNNHQSEEISSNGFKLMCYNQILPIQPGNVTNGQFQDILDSYNMFP